MYNDHYSVKNAEKTQKLRNEYIKKGISALKGQNAPIILSESEINSHREEILRCGIDLPNNALRFGRAFIDDWSYIYYGVGGFDCWCVFERDWNGYEWEEVVPLDKEYFQILKFAADTYGVETVWDDFWKIYLRTGSEIDYDVFREIHEISQKYQPALLMEKTLSIIYLAMISEENKILGINKKTGKPIMTKLGKTVKALGLYQVLILKMSPEEASAFSKNPKGGYKAIENLCKSYNIIREYI